MMQDVFDLKTLIFLCLAVFVIWKLRSVLGQKTGSEQPPADFANKDVQPGSPRDSWQNQSRDRQAGDSDTVIALPPRQAAQQKPVELSRDRWKGIAEIGTPLADTLDRMVALEPIFDPRTFLEGAKVAYEMVVTAFARGERQELKDLLTKDVYAGFEQAISDREKRGEKVETTFVSIDKSELQSAELVGSDGQLTVRFASKLITATRNAQGQIIDGSAETVIDVVDIWTFARKLGTNDPNWLLAATESGQ